MARYGEEAPAQREAEAEGLEMNTAPADARGTMIWAFPAFSLLCLVLLAALPGARLGAGAILNRLFDESEKVNAYVYSRFSVPEGQSAALAWVLLCGAAAGLVGWAAASRGPLIAAILYAILAAAQAQALLRRSGCLVVYRSAAAFASARGEWEMRRRRGIDWEKVEGPRLRELVPALAPDFACGVLQPDHGYVVDPRGLVRRLVAQMRSDGADLVQGRARDIGSSSDRLDIVLDDGRKLAADRVVLAAGAWSRPLAAKLGAAIPLETQRGYHLHLGAPRIDLPLPVSFAEGKFYATPMSDGLRLAGTVEFAGLRAAPDYRRAHRLAEMAGRWLPGLGLDGASEWMGHRPCLPDSLPVIGPSPRDPRVLLAFGHGHNGMTSAPATGRLVADMVAGRRPFIDPSPYRPDRF